MSNAYMSRFCSIHQTGATALDPKRTCVIQFFRNFSSCNSLIVAPAASVTASSPSSLVLAAQLSPAGTTQRSEEWFALRRDKLTTSTFSTALGFWKGARRTELWYEKVFASDAQCMEASTIRAMEWGVLNEAAAIERYKNITGHDVSFLGFAIHPEQSLHWLGASPDGLLSCFPEAGILEVKCPYNKGKPELGLPWSTMPFYYMPQIQGQMEIMDREWVDLYCWTPNGSTIFRVRREREYWELIRGILREFWWENVIPAREALLVGGEEAAKLYEPAARHRQTGEVVAKSIKLAAEAKLLCKDIAGHVEFYT
uniref:YqaJ viral recombinase domain-containing protein n=1 Tax=Opuntia streptacantha TaxID=393608 RepID=A0A7C9EZ66_OPUST